MTPHVTEGHIGRRFLDISGLPTHTLGHQDAMWWGMWLLLSIEGTMFALLTTAYFYLRGNQSEWPPPGATNPPLAITVTTVVLLLLAAAAMFFAFRAAADARLPVIRLAFAATTLLGTLALAARAGELATIGYRWNSHAYGSLVWGFYFLHSVHLLAAVTLSALFTALFYLGPVEFKRLRDVRLVAFFWWFGAAGWLLVWAIVTFDDLLLRNSLVS